jgi:hypothetical protein
MKFAKWVGASLALLGFGSITCAAATTISSVTGPAPDVYGPSHPLSISVAYSSAVTVTGIPSIRLTIGTTAHAASYTGAVGNSLQFRYTPATGDNGAVQVNGHIDLNGGRIADSSGVDTPVTFPPPDATAVTVDTTPPAVPTVSYATQTATPAFGGSGEPGSSIELHDSTHTYTGGPVTVTGDGAWHTDWTGAAIPPGTYYFYAVATDKAGNASAPSSTIQVDVPNPAAPPPTSTPGAGPTVTKAALDGTGGYTNGAVDLRLTFSAGVMVGGWPRIPVTVGPNSGWANYVGGGGNTNFIVFRYYVASGRDNALVSFGNTIDLNGGWIQDIAGHNASLQFTPPTSPQIYADGVPPNAPVITSITQSATPTLVGTAEPNSVVTVTIDGKGGRAVASQGPNGDGWQIDWASLPISPGTYSVRAYAMDAAFNVSAASAPSTLVVPSVTPSTGADTTPPLPANWKPGVVDPAAPDVVRFWYGFTEPVTGFDASDVSVTLTGSAKATVQTLIPDASGSGYTVPVQFSGSGTMTLRVPGGTAANIRDLAGNLYRDPADSYVTFTLPTPQAPIISSPLSANATVGTPFSYTVTATNSPTSYSASSSATLSWLRWDASSHTLSGVPTESTVVGVSLGASNAAGTGTATLTIDVHTRDGTSGTVYTQPPVVYDTTISGIAGVPIIPVHIQTTGGPTIYNAPDLGSYGLIINYSTGDISGTPTKAADNVAVPIVVSSPAGISAPANIFLKISPAPVTGGTGPGTPPSGSTPPDSGVPVVTSVTVNGQIGVPITPVQVTATHSPTLFIASGLQLYGLTMDANGRISGTPTASTSAFGVQVTASNASGISAPATITLNIASASAASSGATKPVTITSDQTVDLRAATTAAPVSYTVVSGPATVVNNQLVFTGSGTVVVSATQSSDTSTPAGAATLTFSAVPVDRLVNISSRMHVDPSGANPAIVGFVVTGSMPKQMLVRAVGPSLAHFGVSDAVADPGVTLFDSKGNRIATNAGWNNDAAISAASDAVGAFKLDAGSKDAATLQTLSPGAYTAVVSAGSSGTVLIEVYDAALNAAVPTKQLANISARSTVNGSSVPLVGGFVVSGTMSKRVLIRGIGPGLAQFGVGDVLADPVVKVYNSDGAVIAVNDNWETPQPVDAVQVVPSASDIAAATSAVGAFALPSGSTDAALLITLPPGSYSAVVTGSRGSAGAALVEVYEVPE